MQHRGGFGLYFPLLTPVYADTMETCQAVRRVHWLETDTDGRHVTRNMIQLLWC
jgi:hypothetical protein